MMRQSWKSAILAAVFFISAPIAMAETALVAVAANFAEVTQKLETLFEEKTGHELTITTGSTGKLYAQALNGAPYDIILAADQARPALLEKNGLTAARFTYALGHLTLWSADAELIKGDGAALLRAGSFEFLAIANPDLAPYGFAARQALQKLELWESLKSKIVMGENAGQTFSMVATGNASLGLVAKSYALSARNGQKGSLWHVPQKLYDPIRQDAVLLKSSKNNAAASAFMAFLHSDEAKTVIKSFGYGID